MPPMSKTIARNDSAARMLRRSSAGPNQLLFRPFQPALPLAGPFETATETDGCRPLLEATIR